jgi:hypothetical protein
MPHRSFTPAKRGTSTWQGYYTRTRLLLENKASVDQANTKGDIPLLYSSEMGNIEPHRVERLLALYCLNLVNKASNTNKHTPPRRRPTFLLTPLCPTFSFHNDQNLDSAQCSRVF